ncbi:MAG: short-chain fatty acid transporter [Sandaracinaceae bacterium]|nr:short-chain fatty acid transporter [Sandaracinaceae bacterium]
MQTHGRRQFARSAVHSARQLDKVRAVAADLENPTRLERVAAAFTRWAERTIPDAFVFALIGTVIVVVAASVRPEVRTLDVVEIWGKGFWELLPFTLQMALVVITGYVLATTRPVHRLIERLASIPKGARTAVAFVAFIAMVSSWFNWGFGLMFSAMLAKEVARRVQAADYRALAASAFLGLGSVWAQGLSGSAALQMATPSALQPAIRTIIEGDGQVPHGVIPLTHTIFLWQSLVSVFVEILVVTLVVYFAAPTGMRAKNAAALGISLDADVAVHEEQVQAKTKGEWLEYSPILSVLVVVLATTYLARYFWKSENGLASITLDTINLAFLTVGIALHGTPHRLMKSVREATPAVWGIILQFPFYAGIAAVVSKTHLNEMIASWFVQLSNRETFPALTAMYSALLGVFVPSGGSKWVIEAPYVMQAAHELHVHLGWTVAVYDLGEALANLVQPFWMLPVLGLFRLRARDVMGFTFLIFLVLLPLVLILVTFLGMTLEYPL